MECGVTLPILYGHVALRPGYRFRGKNRFLLAARLHKTGPYWFQEQKKEWTPALSLVLYTCHGGITQ